MLAKHCWLVKPNPIGERYMWFGLTDRACHCRRHSMGLAFQRYESSEMLQLKDDAWLRARTHSTQLRFRSLSFTKSLSAPVGSSTVSASRTVTGLTLSLDDNRLRIVVTSEEGYTISKIRLSVSSRGRGAEPALIVSSFNTRSPLSTRASVSVSWAALNIVWMTLCGRAFNATLTSPWSAIASSNATAASETQLQ